MRHFRSHRRFPFQAQRSYNAGNRNQREKCAFRHNVVAMNQIVILPLLLLVYCHFSFSRFHERACERVRPYRGIHPCCLRLHQVDATVPKSKPKPQALKERAALEMSAKPCAAAAVTAAKKAMRSQHLAELRSWAKASPETVHTNSQILCDKLFTHITDRYLQPRPLVAAGAPSSRPALPTLYVCTYLPLYYEVNVEPLMERLWALEAARQSSTTAQEGVFSSLSSSSCAASLAQPEVVVMVPIVLEPTRTKAASTAGSPGSLCDVKEWHQPCETAASRLQSAMLFVEVRDAADLRNAFEVKGKYHIRELKDEVLLQLFQRQPALDRSADAMATQQRPDLATRAASDEVMPSRPRRLLCCDAWERLFPEHKPPAGLLRLPDAASSVHTTGMSILVLTPGVRFSKATGARLGKGGGFYDRFLGHLHRHVFYPQTATAEGSSGECTAGSQGGKVEVDVVGIAFDTQVTAEDVAADAATDAPVSAVGSPRGGVEKVPTSYWTQG